MSTTIDSLDIQISTSSGQSAEKIQAIANALGDLKNQGKIGAATSAMKSLAKALDVLNPALNGLDPTKLQQVRDALSGFANIQKLSGLNSAVNTLKKIPDVINGLDASKLDLFEKQMTRLATVLAPLSKQLDKVGTAFSKLPPRVSQVVTATNKMAKATQEAADADENHNKAINAKSLNLMSAIHNFTAVTHAIHMVGNMIKSTMAQAMEWDGIQYRFGRAFGEDAEEVYAYAQKINDVLGINIQQFMQYSSLYGSLLSGFGMAQDKVTTISVGLTELSYDIWAAYNDRFKTLEDASEAVRSAITGEIEPIRNAGIALTEASLQEYLDSVGMAKVSIEKLSEAQKAEIRYAAMMDAALNQGIIGTYASEMQTAEGAVRNLSQAFKGLVQAFGSLFIPILQTAIPYVTAFINLLHEAIAAIASFFGITFFEIDWGNGVSSELEAAAVGAGAIESGMGGAADAAKKLKDYTMGFDELNIIQPQTESGGGGGGGAGGAGANWGDGLDLKTMWDESVFAKASQQVDELKQKIKDWFEEWKTEIAIVAGALGVLNIASLLGSLGNAIGLGEKFVGLMGTIKKLAATAIIITLQYSLMSEFLGDFIKDGSWADYIKAMIVGAIGTGILYSMWGPAGLTIGLSVTAVASFKAVFENGGIDSTESAVTALTGVASAIGAIITGVAALKGLKVANIFGAIFKAIGGSSAAKSALTFMFPTATSIATTAAAWVSGTLVPTITSAITTGLGAVAAALGVSVGWAAAIVAAIVAAIGGAIWAATHWDEVTRFFTETVPEWFSGVKDAVTDWWSKFDLGATVRKAMGDAKDWFEGVRDDVNEFWDGVIEDIDSIDWAGLGYDVGKKVGEAFRDAKDWFNGVIESVKNFDLGEAIREAMSNAEEWFNSAKKDFEEAWDKFWGETAPELVGNLIKFFTEELPAWKEDMKQIGQDIVDGIWEGIKGAWKEFWKGVGEWIDGFVEGFEDALEINSPSKVFERIGRFIVEGLMGGISAKWDDLKRWFNSNVAPKFTLNYWKEKFDTVKRGAKQKLDEAKQAISDAWGGIKSWFNTNVAPKLTLAYWKEKFNNIAQGIKDKWSEARAWWNNNKPSLATVQATVASIKEKLSSAWDTARTWWNENKPSLSKISVTVDSIKSKIESAWNTAKDWLDKQGMKLNIKTPHFSVGWNYNISDTMATIADFLFDRRALPKINVSWYAQGGMPSMGELFVAREAGPELVGKIGSRNAVVNNDQIVEAVSRGVYDAVAAAMGGYAGGSDQTINVYLDGKQITAAVEKHQRQRGATLMTGGMAYGY